MTAPIPSLTKYNVSEQPAASAKAADPSPSSKTRLLTNDDMLQSVGINDIITIVYKNTSERQAIQFQGKAWGFNNDFHKIPAIKGITVRANIPISIPIENIAYIIAGNAEFNSIATTRSKFLESESFDEITPGDRDKTPSPPAPDSCCTIL